MDKADDGSYAESEKGELLLHTRFSLIAPGPPEATCLGAVLCSEEDLEAQMSLTRHPLSCPDLC